MAKKDPLSLDGLIDSLGARRAISDEFIEDQVELCMEEYAGIQMDQQELADELRKAYVAPLAEYKVFKKKFRLRRKKKEVTVEGLLRLAEVTDSADRITSMFELVLTAITRGKSPLHPYLEILETTAKMPIIYAIANEFGHDYAKRLLVVEAAGTVPIIGNIIDLHDTYVATVEEAVRKRAVDSVLERQGP